MIEKKKLFSGLFALALLATMAVGVAESKKSETTMSDLAMANVEALANGEDGWDCKIYANGALMNTCYGYRKKV